MPKLKPATQRARREHILDAAEVCFARSGFHGTTMQDICKEALISPGALYVYFASKEELIAGLAERDRAEFQERFAELSQAPDFMKALGALGERYFVEEPAHKRTMCLEIGLESTRNAKVGDIYRAVDRYVAESFEKLFARLAAEGRIAPDMDVPTVAKVFSVLGDGLFMRRALDPDFEPDVVIPAVMKLVEKLLGPQPDNGEPRGEREEQATEPRR
ncbi:MAG TPA: TetR/AcrR family transcriptional regulator [Hyphomicrobium sp.]|jgi:AcrR family transcriptional regulator